MSSPVTETPTQLRHGVAEEIRVILARRRMSATKFAEQLGWSQTYMARRMIGAFPFSVDDLAQIAEALSVHVVDLLPREQREGVTPRYRGARRDAMSLLPPSAPTSPYSGLRGPLPDKMTLGPIGRSTAPLKTDARPTLVRPRGI